MAARIDQGDLECKTRNLTETARIRLRRRAVAIANQSGGCMIRVASAANSPTSSASTAATARVHLNDNNVT